jgi:hypothetical protein
MSEWVAHRVKREKEPRVAASRSGAAPCRWRAKTRTRSSASAPPALREFFGNYCPEPSPKKFRQQPKCWFHLCFSRVALAIPAGFEPATHGVEIRYSTNAGSVKLRPECSITFDGRIMIVDACSHRLRYLGRALVNSCERTQPSQGWGPLQIIAPASRDTVIQIAEGSRRERTYRH